ncbi:Succinate dehydrogenase subunit 5, mitochondrial, partial [Linum grandiflorum]
NYHLSVTNKIKTLQSKNQKSPGEPRDFAYVPSSALPPSTTVAFEDPGTIKKTKQSYDLRRKMEKMVALRYLYRAAALRSSMGFTAIASNQLLHHHSASRSLFTISPAAQHISCSSRSPFGIGIGSTRSFSVDVAHLPEIKDNDVLCAFKDLMAASWDELDASVVHDVHNALSKNSEDKAGQEILQNVFRASEAVEEFGGMVMTLKMELDDSIGMSGEDVKPLSDEYAKAIRTFFERYTAYLDSFGVDETYLRKKVEMELGSKMIFLKMRCAGLGSEWSKVSLIGTSGLAGSYVEQRA